MASLCRITSTTASEPTMISFISSIKTGGKGLLIQTGESDNLLKEVMFKLRPEDELGR